MSRVIVRFILAIFLTVEVFQPGPALARGEVPAQPDVKSEGAILVDMESGQVLYQKNEDERLYPASTTKILTALVVLKRADLAEKARVPREACLTGGSAVGLQEDEILSVNDLLYAMLLSSANDAAETLGIHVGGSEEGFARLMNEEAHAIGAVNSNFVNPHGMPDPNHYTTARDLALIAREAMKNSVFRKIVGTYHYRIERTLPRPVEGIPQVDYVNHNRLLWSGSTYGYEGATGIKNGYTSEAGNCLVASAERNGHELLAVMLNSGAYDVYQDAINLFDYGFNQFNHVVLVEKGAEVGSAGVRRGVEKNIGVLTAEGFCYNIPVGDGQAIENEVNIDKNITAPVEKGQKVGTMRFLKGGEEIGSVDLVADRGVERSPLFRWWYVPVLLLALLLFLRIQTLLRRRKYMARRKRRMY
ncbi:MAG: D-alanyl-D-alanine carboxypeptidase family protein [Bacillota bacterium]